MFEPVNIVSELKGKQKAFDLSEVHKILAEESQKDESIKKSITSSKGKEQDLTLPQDAVVFDLSVISTVCEQYRLRFLPGKYFKGEIPYEALIKVKELEKVTNSKITEFMIIAPADLFNLKDEYEDPVLVTPLGDNKYLFIHQWGNDMTWYRKLIYFPLRNFDTYLITLVSLALIITYIIPWNWIVREKSVYDESFFYYRIMLFGSCLTWFFVMSFYYGFVSRKNFSKSDWDSVYF